MAFGLEVSNSLPPVTVLVVTWNRPAVIRRTIHALIEHIRYPDLLWHIADDSSPGEYVAHLRQDFPQLEFTATVTDRLGWGANVNEALINCWSRSHYVFLCEDDYVVKRDLDLVCGVAVLEAAPRLGLIRYDGIAGHALDLQLREVGTKAGYMQCMTIMRASPHLNLYSHRPHLVHKRFHDHYGMYLTNDIIKCATVGRKIRSLLGECESEFAHRVKDKYEKGPKIAVLADGVMAAFDHIGHSRQGTEDDK